MGGKHYHGTRNSAEGALGKKSLCRIGRSEYKNLFITTAKRKGRGQ